MLLIVCTSLCCGKPQTYSCDAHTLLTMQEHEVQTCQETSQNPTMNDAAGPVRRHALLQLPSLLLLAL